MSSTTYQAIILPANYKIGHVHDEAADDGRVHAHRVHRRASARHYDRFAGWWGGTAPLDGVDVTYYTVGRGRGRRAARRPDRPDRPDPARDRPRAVQQLERADLPGARRDAPRDAACASTSTTRSSDYRVRQAIALTLDRPAIIKTLFNGLADLGNDSPFAPVYPSHDPSVPQRKQEHRDGQAADGGRRQREGLHRSRSRPRRRARSRELAQIIQQSVKAIGINMTLVDPERRRRTSPARRPGRRRAGATRRG